MGKKVEGPEALALLHLLEQLDKGELLTSEIQQELYEISELDLTEQGIEHLPTNIDRLTNLKELCLQFNYLSYLPDSLGNLSNLQALYIARNKLSSLPDSLGNLSNLQTLDISENKFSSLPDSLGNLSNLQILDVCGNDLSFLSEILGNLSNLQALYIARNKLSSLPDSLGNLSNLQTLYITQNQLSSLPDSLGNLLNLQALYITQNKLSFLPHSLGNLSSLKELYIGYNSLSSLPHSLGNLFNLQILNIKGNELSSLPDSLGNLSNLQSLNIRENNFSSLPNQLGNLLNLKELYISHNPLSFLPSFLSDLFNLYCLDISYTKIDKLPSWIGSFKQLRSLNLSGLNLRFLPPEILDLRLPFCFFIDPSNKKGVNLYKATLSTQPIRIFKQPRKLIQAYFDNPKIPIHKTKVIFLGDGGAGKTHIIHRIQNDCQSGEYYTEMTPGVEITSFQTQNNDLTINFWDFGGQEIMPSIHRCFLTQRALYVIVVSTRTGNLTVQARHWLKNIEAFSPGAPVLIAVNCWDNTTSCGVNNELLYEEFPNLLQTIIFSAKCSSRQEFYQRLLLPIEEYSRKMDSYSMELPENWLHIEQTLCRQEKPYITGSDYLKTCYENGLEDEQIAQWLLEWFNDMGVCFSYSDDNGRPYQILRPEWLTNAVYRILLDEAEPNSKGIVKRKYIERSLTCSGYGTRPEITYTQAECNAIFAVMEKFRLAYSINEQELFIPALCSEKMPDLTLPENCKQRLEYELQYTYLPDCVVHQLMIWYLETNITPKHVWRSGLCIQERTRWAVITGDFQRAKLHIQLYMQPDSSAQNCYDMLKDIYQAIQEINNRLALEATDCIVMHEGTQTAHFPLGPLLEAKKKGWTELPSLEDGEFHVYNIDQILDSAFNPQEVQAVLKQDHQSDLGGMVANTIYQINITNHTQNGWSVDEARAFVSALLENQNLLTEEIITKIINLLHQEKDSKLQQLGQNMDKSKSPIQWLKDFISDAAKTGKDIQTLYNLAQVVCKVIPAVLDAMKNLL